MNVITSYTHIKNNCVYVNGALVFETSADKSLSEFLIEAYKIAEVNYPKFHKMDAQCKLGMLATEFTLKNTDVLLNHSLDKTAIVLSNSASSLETDKQYQASIADKANYFPSPAVFVYTLPNIVIGEIAIKHKITGENAFFISDSFDAQLLVNYTEILLQTNTTAVISGWVNVDAPQAEAFIFLVEKTNKNSIFKPLNHLTVINLYK